MSSRLMPKILEEVVIRRHVGQAAHIEDVIDVLVRRVQADENGRCWRSPGRYHPAVVGIDEIELNLVGVGTNG